VARAIQTFFPFSGILSLSVAALVICHVSSRFSCIFLVVPLFLFPSLRTLAGQTELKVARISRVAKREWHCIEHPEASVVVDKKKAAKDAAKAAAAAAAAAPAQAEAAAAAPAQAQSP
jgi:hypothetical protein